MKFVSAPRSSRREPLYFTKLGSARSTFRREVLDRIESRRDAARNRDVNLRALRRSEELRPLAHAIAGCADDDPCAMVLCPRCARQYRLWLAQEILLRASERLPACALTILLRAAQGRDLRRVDLKAEQLILRKRLSRAGFLAVAGGTEASYDTAKDIWTVHVHLIVFGDIDEALPR